MVDIVQQGGEIASSRDFHIAPTNTRYGDYRAVTPSLPPALPRGILRLMERTSPSSHRWRVWQGQSGQAHVTITWRSWALVPFALLFLLAELISPSQVWAGLLIVLVGTMVAAAWWAWQMARRVEVRRELRFAWMQVGDHLEERFTLVNGAPVPALWMEIVDHSNLPGYSANTVRAAEAQQRVRWSVQGTCGLRGEYRLGPWAVRLSDPFGLFLVTLTYPATETILVYPPIARWRTPALPRGAASGQASARARARQPTAAVRTVREYVPGDPFRHIHWPTTARRGNFHVREFDQETGGDVWFLLDLDREVQAGVGKHSTLEVGVILTASLAVQLLDANRRVGLLAYGQEPRVVRPGQGLEHLWRILHALALAQPAAGQPLARVLEEAGRVLPANSTLLLLTPSTDPDWVAALAYLRRRGVASQALLLAVGDTRRSAPLRALLARLGVEAEIVNTLAPLQLVPPTGRSYRWEFKVLPTGHAVPVSRPGTGGGRWPTG